ncbi:MAG: DUF4145 domain-containing protein [Fimbriimonadaceae bacterium]|nr:DUF4145 domain-containing protein [Fimbriimonadaceae bacterium]
MKPELGLNGSVIAPSPDNGDAPTTFELMSGQPFVTLDRSFTVDGNRYSRKIWYLMRSATTGEGGVKVCVDNGNQASEHLIDFYPTAVFRHPLPTSTPVAVVEEYREAEVCFAHGANRAASALLRSALEKVLKLNGFIKGSLQAKIDEAAADGVITESRKKKAHEDIRVLGNDVLHDEYRAVSEGEVAQSLKYLQRVLEDLYDDRETVRQILTSKGRALTEEGSK